MNTQVYVIGVHRSGTSMIAGILQHLGVEMRLDSKKNRLEALRFPSRHDPYMTYECQNLCNINTRCYEALCKDRRRADANMWKELANHKIIQRIKKYIRQRDAQNKIWGAKDPRMVPFLPLYRPFSSNMKVILVRRNIRSNMESISRRDMIGLTVAESIVKRHQKILDIYEQDETINKLVVEYQYTKENKEKTIKRICEFLDIKQTEKQMEQTIKFVR